jgi:hypothetical protein
MRVFLPSLDTRRNPELTFALSRIREAQRRESKYLLATLMDVSWPLKPPFQPEPFRLLDEIALEKTKKRSS